MIENITQKVSKTTAIARYVIIESTCEADDNNSAAGKDVVYQRAYGVDGCNMELC